MAAAAKLSCATVRRLSLSGAGFLGAWHLGVGDALLDIEWDGHRISAADELYHTRFETFTGLTTLTAPVAGRVVAMQPPSAAAVWDLDSHAWLAELEVEEAALC